MDYTQVLGNTNELICMIKFMLLGYDCSVPYGNGARYDFIVDLGNKLIKVQCKSSHYVNDHGTINTDAILFSTITTTSNTKETVRRKYNETEIDYFATSFNNKVYVIPVSECSTSKTLRFHPPKNGMTYNKAEDYEIEKVFGYSEQYLESKDNYLSRPISNNNNKEIVHNHCEECGKEISYGSNLCSKCAHIKLRKVDRPDRDLFKELIWTKSFKEIGRTYNVSDKTISKWCVAYNLPSKKCDIKNYTEEEWKTI